MELQDAIIENFIDILPPARIDVAIATTAGGRKISHINTLPYQTQAGIGGSALAGILSIMNRIDLLETV
jgi:hypothetical protein